MAHPAYQDLLTVKQVAEITNYSQEHIRRLIRDGKLEADQPGRKYFITHAALNAFIRSAELSKEERIRAFARKDAMQDVAPTPEELTALRALLS